MWMMGYNDGTELNMPDSFNGRKLRPLMPRPIPSPNNLFALNHHPSMGDQNKRDFNPQPVVVSSRWNPTPEQLRTLEELYRRGTRTPSADQIQHITAQLRRYGKIEGKNVFYWFQNHKARERQKRRRQIESAADEQSRSVDIFERKDASANRTGYEVEQTKNWTVPTNCSTLAEESVSIKTAAKVAMAECKADGWIQFNEEDLQHRRSFVQRNATWQKMQLSANNPTLTATAITTTSATTPLMDPKQLIKFHDLNIFISPSGHCGDGGSGRSTNNAFNGGGGGIRNHDHEELNEESQTLQLFPLRGGCDGGGDIKEKENEISTLNANLTPYQFFEFLPLKN